MSTSQPGAARPSPDRTTPTCAPATGTEVAPEDMVLATGRDLTPRNLAWARRKLDEEGPGAIEKVLP